MKRSTRNPAKSKQEIIVAAAALFNKHGYAGTKMQMILDASGYQMGGVYRHFGNKKELALAALRYNYALLKQHNLQIDPKLSPKEQLLTILENYKKMIFKPIIKGGCPILNSATEADDTDEEIRALAKELMDDAIETIRQILAAGIVQGDFKAHLNPQKEAYYLFATFEGAVMIGSLARKAQPMFDIFERLQMYLADRVFKS